MSPRPYVLLSCAISLDGYLDDASTERLVLSGAADLDRVDALRAGCDAILVGASTVRRDDPRLLVRSAERRAERTARGLPASPLRATVTSTGNLDPEARIFTVGDAERVVYCATPALPTLRRRLASAGAAVVDAGEPTDLARVLDDLGERARAVSQGADRDADRDADQQPSRAARRIMVEGGRAILTQLLSAGLADELQLAVAPVIVGDSRAPRFLGDGAYPWHGSQRARLVEVAQVGDTAVLRYDLSRSSRP